MSALSVMKSSANSGPRPRFTWPVHFYKLSVFQFWFVAFVLGFASEFVDGKDYFSTTRRRSCVCNGYDSNIDYFPIKVFPDEAEFWDVEYHKSYKVVTDLRNNRRTILYLCGTPRPDVIDSGDQVVEIPIKKASVDSSSMYTYFEYINQRKSIVHGSTYATSPCMQQLVADGHIQSSWSVPLAQSEVDFAFISKYSYDQSATKDFGKDYFVLDAANEPSAIGQLEYTKLVSLFFNREEAAQDITKHVKKRMKCHKKKKQKGKLNVAIVSLLSIPGNTDCGNIAKNTMVRVRRCNSGHPECDILKAAKAKMLTNFPKSESFSLKTFVKKARKAHVIFFQADMVNPGFWGSSGYEGITGECLSNFKKEIEKTKAGKNGNIYDIYKTKSVGGATAFFEGYRAEPDIVMLDILSALRPKKYKNHNRVFYRKAWGNDIEATTVLSAEDCVDADAPLYNEWTKKACDSETPNVVTNGLDDLRIGDICKN